VYATRRDNSLEIRDGIREKLDFVRDQDILPLRYLTERLVGSRDVYVWELVCKTSQYMYESVPVILEPRIAMTVVLKAFALSSARPQNRASFAVDARHRNRAN